MYWFIFYKVTHARYDIIYWKFITLKDSLYLSERFKENDKWDTTAFSNAYITKEIFLVLLYCIQHKKDFRFQRIWKHWFSYLSNDEIYFWVELKSWNFYNAIESKTEDIWNPDICRSSFSDSVLR